MKKLKDKFKLEGSNSDSLNFKKKEKLSRASERNKELPESRGTIQMLRILVALKRDNSIQKKKTILLITPQA